jgi:hypothetical protein
VQRPGRAEVQKTDHETPTKLELYELNTDFVSGLGMLLWHDLEQGQGLKYAYQPDGQNLLGMWNNVKNLFDL